MAMRASQRGGSEGRQWRSAFTAGAMLIALFAMVGVVDLVNAALGQAPATPESKVLLTAGGAFEESARTGERSGHGWGVIRLPSARSSGDSWSLVHLPPRGTGSGGKPGTVRRVVELVRAPEGLSADGSKVYLFFAPEPGGPFAAPEGQSRMHRRVSMVEAARIDVSDSAFGWEYRPVGGPEAVASLPGTGALLATAGGGGQLAAIVAGERGPEMFVLGRGRWLRVNLPASMAEARDGDGLTLVGTARGVVVSASAKRSMRLVDVAQLPAGEALADVPPRGAGVIGTGVAMWEDSGLGVLPTAGLAGERVMVVDGQVLRTRVEPGPGGGRGAVRIAVSRPSPAGETGAGAQSGEMELSVVEGVGLPVGVVPMDGSGRVVVMWSRPGDVSAVSTEGEGEPTTGGAPRRVPTSDRGVQVREVSVHTGRADLYEGTSRREGPISQQEFFALSAILLVMVAAVLLFVLRSERRQTFWLPRGMALAPIAVRINGAMLDIVPGMLVACLAFGTTPFGVLGLRAGGLSEHGLWPMFTMLTVTMAVGALLEWRTGRSLGKFVTGALLVTAVLPIAGKGDARRGQDGDAHVGEESDDAAGGQNASDAEDASGPGAGDGYEPVGLLRCLVRNVFKWIPPFGLVMFFDANGRHVGDVLSRSVVVVDAPDPSPGAAGGGPRREGEREGERGGEGRDEG